MKILFTFCSTLILLLSISKPSGAEPRKVLFSPPEGKVLLIVGEDKTSTDDYARGIGIIPGGTMVYTAIQDTGSLKTAVDNGGGIQDGQYLLDQYPHSVIQVGLWMVGGLEGTVKGDYDRNIDKIGVWIKQAKRPVFLRIGYEFDLPANNYDPKEYRLAFRYIVDRLRKEGVKNAAFVWHSYANLPPYPLEDWYPGDDHVDWFAVSVFGKPNIYMKNFAQMARKHHKGFMIAESAPQGDGSKYGMTSWNLWYESYFQFIHDEKVRIACYIDLNWETIPMFKGQGWGDSRVEANSIVKKKWLEEIQNGKYLNASPGLFKLLEQ
jgi:Glycosyl hydrolase family 26